MGKVHIIERVQGTQRIRDLLISDELMHKLETQFEMFNGLLIDYWVEEEEYIFDAVLIGEFMTDPSKIEPSNVDTQIIEITEEDVKNLKYWYDIDLSQGLKFRVDRNLIENTGNDLNEAIHRIVNKWYGNVISLKRQTNEIAVEEIVIGDLVKFNTRWFDLCPVVKKYFINRDAVFNPDDLFMVSKITGTLVEITRPESDFNIKIEQIFLETLNSLDKPEIPENIWLVNNIFSKNNDEGLLTESKEILTNRNFDLLSGSSDVNKEKEKITEPEVDTKILFKETIESFGSQYVGIVKNTTDAKKNESKTGKYSGSEVYVEIHCNKDVPYGRTLHINNPLVPRYAKVVIKTKAKFIPQSLVKLIILNNFKVRRPVQLSSLMIPILYLSNKDRKNFRFHYGLNIPKNEMVVMTHNKFVGDAPYLMLQQLQIKYGRGKK